MNHCAGCNSDVEYKAGMKQCPRCGGPLTPKTAAEHSMTSGVIAKPGVTQASSGAKVTFANGVYKAERDGVTAFGTTEEQALKKLAAPPPPPLAKMQPGTPAQESKDLQNVMNQQPGQPGAQATAPAAQAPIATPPVAPAPVPPAPVPVAQAEASPPTPTKGGTGETSPEFLDQFVQQTAPTDPAQLEELENTTDALVFGPREGNPTEEGGAAPIQ
jgi:hypothetical protein